MHRFHTKLKDNRIYLVYQSPLAEIQPGLEATKWVNLIKRAVFALGVVFIMNCGQLSAQTYEVKVLNSDYKPPSKPDFTYRNTALEKPLVQDCYSIRVQIFQQAGGFGIYQCIRGIFYAG